MAEERKGFFRRLAEGLTKTRNNIVSGMDAIFSGFSDIDDDFYDEIEEILVMGDIGINATTAIDVYKRQDRAFDIREVICYHNKITLWQYTAKEGVML